MIDGIRIVAEDTARAIGRAFARPPLSWALQSIEWLGRNPLVLIGLSVLSGLGLAMVLC